MRRLIPILGFLLVMFLPGCHGNEGGVTSPPSRPPDLGRGGGGGTTAVLSTRWPFWPTRMRIHPLTLLTVDSQSGELIVEARLEFRDEFGHVTKGTGQVRFELHEIDPRLGGSIAAEMWNVDLRESDTNRLHYDEITQTYLFRLELETGQPGRDAHLRAFFLSADGRRLEDISALR